jgi:hypothetical protein
MKKRKERPEDGDLELSYMSPVEKEVLTRKQLKALKRQRRIERKRRKRLLLQTSSSPSGSSSSPLPRITHLPDLSDASSSKKKKTKKQKKAEDLLITIKKEPKEDEAENERPPEVRSELYELKSMSEIIHDYPHLSLDSQEEPLCERQQSMRIKDNQEIPSSSSSSEDEDSKEEKKPKTKDVVKMSASARKKLQLQTQALDPSTLFYHKHAQWEANNPYEYPDFHALLQKNKELYSSYMHGVDALSRQDISPERWYREMSLQTHVVLEKRTASFESLLLKESGKFFDGQRWVYYPSCKNMHKCVGWTQWKSIKGLQRPILLMSSMSEREYEQDVLGHTGSLADHIQGYESRIADRQPCVLCCRYKAHVLLMKHALLLSYGKPTPLQRPVSADMVLEEDDDHVYDMQTLPIQTYYNLKNETEGYDGDYMLDPSKCHNHHNNTLHFQPIVKCCLMKLFAYQDAQLRRVISQEALIWNVKGQGVEPVLGETVSSFLASNKQQVGKNQDVREEHMSSLLQFMVLCLLREYDPAQYIPPTLDLVYVEQQMTNPSLPDNLSYAYTLLYDAYLLSPLYQSMSTEIDLGKRDELGWYYIRCDFTLSSLLDQATHNMAFFSPLADVISPLGHLLTKVLVNARCQHREMDKGVAKTLIQRKIHKRKRSTHKNKDHVIEYDDQVLMIMKQVVLCALLGNYPSDAQNGLRISNMGYRYLLYYLFHNNRRFDQWIVCLFKHSSSVLTFCVRRYMVHVLESNPSMWEVLHQQFRFEEYKGVVISAMKKVQSLFYMMMVGGVYGGVDPRMEDLCRSYQQCMSSVPLEPCNLMKLWDHPRYKDISTGTEQNGVHPSVLPIALQSKQFIDLYLHERANQLRSGWDDQKPHQFHTLLQKELLRFELDYRLLSFSRPYINIALLLRPLRNDYPLVPISNEDTTTILPLVKIEGKEVIEDDIEDEEEREQNNYMFPKDQPHKYLNQDQVRALHEVIRCCGPVGYDSPIQRILDFFPFFEVRDSHVLWLKALFSHYHHNTKSNESIKLALGTLRLINPHAYNLLQLVSIHLDQAQRRFRLMNLPLHIQQAQCRVLSEKGHRDRHKVLLKDLISFVFCPVCCHIYSNVSDFNSVYKHSYTHGYRDVAVDYLSTEKEPIQEGKMYCTNSKSNERGTCGEQELVRIPLIGRMLWLRSKFYMFCCTCGNIMAFDTKQQHYTAHTQDGPCCVRCTRALVHRLGSQTMELLESNYDLSELSCDYCKSIIIHQNQQNNTNLPPPKIKDWKSIHMYGRDHFLCSKHHHIYHTKIEQELSKGEGDNKEQRIIQVLNLFNPTTVSGL